MGNRFTTQITHKGAGLSADNPLTVVIPAAGTGYRMKSYGPTCLLNATKKQTLIEKSEKVIKNLPRNIRIVENFSYDETNMVESLRLGINNSVTDNLLIIDGDLIFNISTIKGITSTGSSCVLVDSKNSLRQDKVGMTIVEDYVTSFSFGLGQKWGKIAYLKGKEFDMFYKLCLDKKKNKMFTFELFNIMINDECNLQSYDPKGAIIKEIDSLKDLQ